MLSGFWEDGHAGDKDPGQKAFRSSSLVEGRLDIYIYIHMTELNGSAVRRTIASGARGRLDDLGADTIMQAA
jgi:hypothetical protein